MSFHSRIRHFGRLELLETYEFYDKPVLVACRNAAGALFFAVLAQDSPEAETWLYVMVSRERFIQVRSGALDLQTSFRESEDDTVFRITLPVPQGSRVDVEPLRGQDLPPDLLPLPGERLSLWTDTLPSFPGESLTEEATRSRRDLLKLSFDLPEVYRTEAPARFLGRVLASVQDAISSIAQSFEDLDVPRQRVSRQVLAETELAVLGLGSGSFEVKLASSSSADATGRTGASLAIGEFIQLLQLGSRTGPLQERLHRLQPKAVASYLAFLRSLDKRATSTRAEWGSPSLRMDIAAALPAETVREAISLLERETFESVGEQMIVGRLTGASLTKKTFEVTITGGQREVPLTGRIADRAISSMQGAVLDRLYRLRIKRKQVVRPVSGKVSEEIHLLDLMPIEPPAAD